MRKVRWSAAVKLRAFHEILVVYHVSPQLPVYMGTLGQAVGGSRLAGFGNVRAEIGCRVDSCHIRHLETGAQVSCWSSEGCAYMSILTFGGILASLIIEVAYVCVVCMYVE